MFNTDSDSDNKGWVYKSFTDTGNPQDGHHTAFLFYYTAFLFHLNKPETSETGFSWSAEALLTTRTWQLAGIWTRNALPAVPASVWRLRHSLKLIPRFCAERDRTGGSRAQTQTEHVRVLTGGHSVNCSVKIKENVREFDLLVWDWYIFGH